MATLLRKIAAMLAGIGRDILRGMRIKHALQNRRFSRCTDFMTDLYRQPPEER